MKILFIATQLPPFIGSGNIRALNYINYLSRLGNEIDVIAVDYPKDSIAYDKNLEDVFDKRVKIHRVNPGLLYNLSYTKKSNINLRNVSETSKTSLKKKLSGFVKRNILIPDPFLQWINPAYKKAISLIEKNGNYVCVLSMHETPSSHVVGYKIKKKFPAIKWVGYWSDPWNGDSLRENRIIFKKALEEKIEKRIVENIDKLLFTSSSTRELYMNKYNLKPDKTDIVYRGYDEQLYRSIEANDNKPIDLKHGKINIIHTGTIYRQLRDIGPLCNALNILKLNNIDIFNKLHLIFIGQFDDKEDEIKLRQFENVTIKPLIPYHVAMEYVVHADVLLLYGNKNSTQIPGKVYEYVGSKAPILTVLGDQTDELNILMRQANKGPVTRNIEIDILNAIKDLYKMIISNKLDESWKQPAPYYKWDNIAKDLQRKVLN